MPVCEYCGANYEEGSKFCSSCGASTVHKTNYANEAVDAEVIDEKPRFEEKKDDSYKINMGEDNTSVLVVVARVFVILGMILGFWMIFPLIFGFIILGKLDHPDNQESMVIWGVISFIFVSRIAGALMIVRAFSK